MSCRSMGFAIPRSASSACATRTAPCSALARSTPDLGHGEIKSMRTAPAALGLGVGGSLLAHLVATARTMGLSRLSLETGNSPLFAAANRHYRRDDFEPCGPFGGYRAADFTTFYTRDI